MIVLHGNDVAFWICDACGVLIGHALLMQAACPTKFPEHTIVQLHPPSGNRRKHFRNSHTLPFFYGDYGRVDPKQSYLHLFGMGEAAAMMFMLECDLCDVQFPARMAGIVLVIAKERVEKTSCKPEFELAWAKMQNLPLAIAATGYNEPEFSLEAFREYFGLEPDTIVVTGPAIDLGRVDGFDPEYAKRVLEALRDWIENPSPTSA